jgi:RNA polymerase sigma factor (sigma-70 family)
LREAVKGVPPLSEAAELRLWRKAKLGADNDARNALIEPHIRTALSMARNFRRPGMCSADWDDLDSAAIMGTYAAIDRWEPSRGRFSGAVYWGILEALSDWTKRQTNKDEARSPEARKGAKRRQTPAPDISFAPISAPLNEDAPGYSLADTIAADAPEYDARGIVASILGELTPRQRAILTRRYLRGEPLAEIAADTGISPTRVAQIEKGARRLDPEMWFQERFIGRFSIGRDKTIARPAKLLRAAPDRNLMREWVAYRHQGIGVLMQKRHQDKAKRDALPFSENRYRGRTLTARQRKQFLAGRPDLTGKNKPI